MKARLTKILTDPRFIFAVYCVVAIVATITQILKNNPDNPWSSYNNFLIFKTSFQHLVSGGDLYQLWPSDHQDYYKYSPAFALLMAPFSWMNIWVGLSIWNLINALALYFAIANSRFAVSRLKSYMLWFVLLELLTSMQSSQSNGLMAALMIFSFNKMEDKKPFLAALFLCLGFYIKIFSLAGFIILLFYPERFKAIFYSAIWMIILFLLPLVAIPYSQLIFLYKSWLHLLADDHSASVGFSVMGWLHTWFNLNPDKMFLAVGGLILLLFPLIRMKQYSQFNFRMMMLASILVWVIIFNHKAESPTFVVAMSGIAIWYFSEKRRMADTILVCLAFIFTSLSPTDLFPAYIRWHLVVPYVLKAVPCIFIWIRIFFELMSKNFGKHLKVAE